jgi:hypothetical protein
MKGIEPSSFGWKPKALPLSYIRINYIYKQKVTVVNNFYIATTRNGGNPLNAIVL